jgi:hypothetical protein
MSKQRKLLILGGILVLAIGGYVYYRRRSNVPDGPAQTDPLTDGSLDGQERTSYIGGTNTSPRYIPYNAFPDYPAYPSPAAPSSTVPPTPAPTPSPVSGTAPIAVTRINPKTGIQNWWWGNATTPKGWHRTPAPIGADVTGAPSSKAPPKETVTKTKTEAEHRDPNPPDTRNGSPSETIPHTHPGGPEVPDKPNIVRFGGPDNGKPNLGNPHPITPTPVSVLRKPPLNVRDTGKAPRDRKPKPTRVHAIR